MVGPPKMLKMLSVSLVYERADRSLKKKPPKRRRHLHVQYWDVSQLSREYITILLMCTVPNVAVRNIRGFWNPQLSMKYLKSHLSVLCLKALTLLTMTRNGQSRLKENGKMVLACLSLCIQVAKYPKGTKLSMKKNVVKSKSHPSIFKKDSEESNEDDEDWGINYEQLRRAINVLLVEIIEKV